MNDSASKINMGEAIKVTLDDQGRILLPAEIKVRLGLSAGMTFVAENADNGELGLRVQQNLPVLVDKGGVLVVRAEADADLANVVRQSRDRRVLDLARRVET